MAYNPISGAAIQYSKSNGQVADGYYLKFYIANTTTPLSMATDGTGSTILTKCKLNDKGYPITNPLDNDSIFIPYVDQSYRFVLYQNETDADTNDTASADVNISEVAPLTEAGGILTRVDSVEGVAGFVGSIDDQQISLKGWHPNSDVGGGILYWDSSLAKSNHNGGTVFSPTVPWTTTADYLNAVGETDPAGSGCWVRSELSENLDVSAFGAVADGATNDFPSMEAMYNAIGRIKLGYRQSYVLNGNLDIPAGTQRKEIDLNWSFVTIGLVSGDKHLFTINGSATVQSYLNYIINGAVDLAGGKGLVDWNSGSFTSGLKSIYIFDSTNRSDSNAVRSFNSFNMVFDDFRTSGSLGGTHLLLEEDNSVSGFHNLTNVKIKNGIMQTSQTGGVLIDIQLPTTAADTIAIENVALKAVGTNAVGLNVDGFINSLKLDGLHLESSDTSFKTAAGSTINASFTNCLVSDVSNVFDWEADGWIFAMNNRIVRGADVRPSKQVFTSMNAIFNVQGDWLVDSGAYSTDILSGSGTFRRDKQLVTEITGTTKTVGRIDDQRTYYRTSGTLTVNLPDTSIVKSGFKVSVMHRGGNVTVNCDSADRILGLSGTTVGGGATTSSTGAYLELICQNEDGTDPFWQAVTAIGTITGF